jgi:hypothetical protein
VENLQTTNERKNMTFEEFCLKICLMVENEMTTVKQTVNTLTLFGYQTTRDVPEDKRCDFIAELIRVNTQAVNLVHSEQSSRQQQ